MMHQVGAGPTPYDILIGKGYKVTTAQDIYKKLISTEETSHHLVLAGLFELVFGRKLQRNEWGMLRKLIRIYGSEMVYWALLASAQANGSTPLPYVMKVCNGMMEEAVAPATDDMLEARTQKRLNELKKIKEELKW